MGVFDVSAEDLALDALVKPGWYTGQLTKVDSKLDKNQNEMDFVTFRLQDAVDHEGSAIPSKTVRDNFGYAYEMGRAKAAKFLRAIGDNIGKSGAKGLEISEERCAGKPLKIYVVNDIYEGNTINKIADYRPV